MSRGQVNVASDDVEKIHELSQQGFGRNWISHQTGVPASTVRRVLQRDNVSVGRRLTTRQITALLFGYGR